MATVTSQAENDFIQTKLQGHGWLGGLEVGGVNTGDWRWVTGPEAAMDGGLGLKFWDGNVGGTPISGVYQNWRTAAQGVAEPNNFQGEEYLHMRDAPAGSEGTWNDYPIAGYPPSFNNGEEVVDGYVVEYGGINGCVPVFTAAGSLTITVEDTEAPTFTCPSDQDVDLNASCELVVPDLVAGISDAMDNCGGTVALSQDPVAGTMLSSAHGMTHDVVITATDGTNPTTCTVTLTGNDATAPTFTCPANQDVDLDGTCQLVVPDLVTGITDAMDNCTVSLSQDPVAGTMLSSAHGMTHDVMITATDGTNPTTCTVTLTGNDATAPTFTCPSDQDVDLNGSCELVVPDLVTGITDAMDNCADPVTLSQDPVAGTMLSSSDGMTHDVVITATDGTNPTTCTVTLTGQDVTAPMITCPASITLNTSDFAGSGSFTYLDGDQFYPLTSDLADAEMSGPDAVVTGGATPSADGICLAGAGEDLSIQAVNWVNTGFRFSFDIKLDAYPSGSGNRPLFSAQNACLLYTSPSPRDQRGSRMPSSA